MLSRILILFFSVLFLSGCATSRKSHTLELQRCQDRISLLEAEIKDKEREIANLEYDVQKKESKSYRNSADPANPSVNQIQKALKNAGYYQGPVDGKIGSKTQDAIKKFQKDNGLKVDGKVGNMTWSELKGYLYY